MDKGNGSPVERLEMDTVVRATPIEGGEFIDRLDGYVSAGLDLEKAGDRRNFDFAGGLSSRTAYANGHWTVPPASPTTAPARPASATTCRAHGGVSCMAATATRAVGKLSRNTELDLSLRTLAGGVFGRYFVQSNLSEWLGGVGLALSRENYAGGESSESVEAVLMTEFPILPLRLSRNGRRRLAHSAA